MNSSRQMCPPNSAAAVRSDASKMSAKNGNKENNDNEVNYTLGDHAQHLGLSFELVDSPCSSVDEKKSISELPATQQRNSKYNRYWFCDWTKHFVPSTHQNRLVRNVVKEYCQPIRQADLEDMTVGTTPLSSMKEDPLAVRTVTIQLRPDCDHIKVFEALNEAFAVIHPKHHEVLKNSDNCFQAIGADGSVPLLLNAQIATSKRIPTLERYVLLRFYHVTQIHLLEEVLQRIGGVQNQKSPLRERQTPLNNKLGEACAMLQRIIQRNEVVEILDERQQQLDDDNKTKRRARTSTATRMTELRLSEQRQSEMASSALKEIPCPMNSTRETTRFFMEKLSESPSVMDENWERLPVFPSLSNRDYDVLQESWPLLDRIWSELELSKCTINTLVDETSRFGQRPCQPTLDKDYCIQLFQVSQQRMMQGLRVHLDKSESLIHDSLTGLSEFEQQLTHVMMRTYHIPLDLEAHNPFNRQDHTSKSLDIGQTPISLTQRNVADFPWEFDDITLALQDITHTITCICLEQDYDPFLHSIQVCDRSVEHIFTALVEACESDLKDFLDRRSRQATIRLTQQQLYLKDFIRKLSNAPVAWDGLPKLQADVKRWQEIAQQASNKDEARPQGNWINSDSAGVTGSSTGRKSFQVPLLEFSTKFGSACVTQNTLILLSELPFFEGVKAYELNKVEVVTAPKHTLQKMAIVRHGKRLVGFTPTSIDTDKLEKFIRTLKSLQR
ncbi:MAG: hypothetical protein SGILL_000751 [Bacillariaceae sp.]